MDVLFQSNEFSAIIPELLQYIELGNSILEINKKFVDK